MPLSRFAVFRCGVAWPSRFFLCQCAVCVYVPVPSAHNIRVQNVYAIHVCNACGSHNGPAECYSG